MKRIVRPPLVVWVERHLRWSLALMAGCGVALFITFMARRMGDARFAGVLLIGSLVLAIVATGLLLKARAFVIDREEGTLEVRLRSRLGFTEVFRFPLAGLIVRLRTLTVHDSGYRTVPWSSTQHRIFIDPPDSDPILFLGGLRGTYGPELARRLSEDLGCPLEVREHEV